jgi:hypothetical protein
MNIRDLIRLPDPRLEVQGEVTEVVQEWQGKPQVFWRLRLSNWRFIPSAHIPFVLVGRVFSHHVRVEPDLMAANAYFDRQLPAARRVTFGWGRTVAWDFPITINPRKVTRLDRKKVPKEIVDLRGKK